MGQKYLLFLEADIADEGYISKIEIVTEEEKKSYLEAGKIGCGFGSIEGPELDITEGCFTKLTASECKLLKKLNLDNVESGYFCEPDDDDDDIDICIECYYHNDRYEENIHPCDECDGVRSFRQKKCKYEERVCPTCSKEYTGQTEFCSRECLIEQRRTEAKET